MNKRLKALRKALGKTQQEFAEEIGIKRNTIATYEAGRNEPIDAVISLICKTDFPEGRVNETWLRTGEGEMFAEPGYDKKLSDFFSSISKDGTSFRKYLISTLADLDDDEWKTLESIFLSISERRSNDER